MVIADVLPGSPAAEQGLRAGDVILSLNGKPMENARPFTVNQYRFRIGQRVELTLSRGGEELSRSVPVAERRGVIGELGDGVHPLRDQLPELSLLAVDFEASIEALVGPRRIAEGVLVASPAPGVALESTPFELGDIIVELNARRVRNVRELRQGLAATAAPWVLQVERHQRLLFVTVEP